MMTPYRVWLDGRALHDLDPAITITDVIETQPAMHITCAPCAMGDGTRVLNRRRESLSVTVCLIIREYATQRRKAVMNKLTAWAQGNELTISDRPGQALRVVAEAMPALGSALKWTSELRLTFTARALPYWYSITPSTVTTQPEASLWVEGTAPAAQVDAVVTTVAGQQARAVTVTAGDTFITLEGLSLPGGSQIHFTHDALGLLRITCGDASLLSCRTAASSDDLLLPPGQQCRVAVAGDAARAVFSAKGVWA